MFSDRKSSDFRMIGIEQEAGSRWVSRCFAAPRPRSFGTTTNSCSPILARLVQRYSWVVVLAWVAMSVALLSLRSALG